MTVIPRRLFGIRLGERRRKPAARGGHCYCLGVEISVREVALPVPHRTQRPFVVSFFRTPIPGRSFPVLVAPVILSS